MDYRERSGSVVESLTRDRGAAGSSTPASLRCDFEQEHYLNLPASIEIVKSYYYASLKHQ